MMGKGQIFVQDLGVSLAISIITIFSLIAFINFSNAQFEGSVRTVHGQAILDRAAEKLFMANEYAFNPTGQFRVTGDFVKFIRSLDEEEAYEQFRNDLSLSREGISYDIELDLGCDDGTMVAGGIRGNEALKRNVLLLMDGKICSANLWVSRR